MLLDSTRQKGATTHHYLGHSALAYAGSIGLQVSMRVRRRKHIALHRGPAPVPAGPTERWSMDFVQPPASSSLSRKARRAYSRGSAPILRANA